MLLEQGLLLLDHRCVEGCGLLGVPGSPDCRSTDPGEERKTDKEGPAGARALALVVGED